MLTERLTPRERRRAIVVTSLLLFFASMLWVSPERVRDGMLGPGPAANDQAQAIFYPRPAPETQGWPVRLQILRIKVDAPIQYLGRTKDGKMDAPKGPDAVGWYGRGVRPGEVGSAVIDGHSGYRTGPAVFDNLPSLRRGDKVHVIDDHGAVTTFVVRELRNYKPDADATEVFNRSDGRYLNLITCTGSWNPLAGTHALRLVVFCDAVD